MTAQQPPEITVPPEPEQPTPLDEAEQMANIEYTQARTYKTMIDANRPPPAPRGNASEARP